MHICFFRLKVLKAIQYVFDWNFDEDACIFLSSLRSMVFDMFAYLMFPSSTMVWYAYLFCFVGIATIIRRKRSICDTTSR